MGPASFPYASRFANAPRGAPNLYQTVCASKSLLDAFTVTADEEAFHYVDRACSLILNELGHFDYGGCSWLRYWPASDAPIVNVQALAGIMFIRGGMFSENERLVGGRPLWPLPTVLATQRENGSWPYSVDGRASFVDGFHTGFILQALMEYGRALPGDAHGGLRGRVPRPRVF